MAQWNVCGYCRVVIRFMYLFTIMVCTQILSLLQGSVDEIIYAP
jgi:hypothetical protein